MTRADIFLLGFKNMSREGHTVHVQTEVSHQDSREYWHTGDTTNT